jgi:hypothetical protein
VETAAEAREEVAEEGEERVEAGAVVATAEGKGEPMVAARGEAAREVARVAAAMAVETAAEAREEVAEEGEERVEAGAVSMAVVRVE